MGRAAVESGNVINYYPCCRLYWADSILNHIREYDLKTRDWKVFYSLSNVKFYGLSLYKVGVNAGRCSTACPTSGSTVSACTR